MSRADGFHAKQGGTAWRGAAALAARAVLALLIGIGPVVAGGLAGWYLTLRLDDGAVARAVAERNAPVVTSAELSAAGLSPEMAAAIAKGGDPDSDGRSIP